MVLNRLKNMQVLCTSALYVAVLFLSPLHCEETTNGIVIESPIIMNEAGQTPTVLLSIIARNEEKTLPSYLGYIERLNYPKSHISIL